MSFREHAVTLPVTLKDEEFRFVSRRCFGMIVAIESRGLKQNGKDEKMLSFETNLKDKY